ncbi:MAG: YHYH protein, partial [Cyanobacteria bacterium J06635_11]
EYPEGIYHYYITEMFPFIPRCVKGTPDESFRPKGGGHGGLGGNRPPRGGHPGGRPDGPPPGGRPPGGRPPGGTRPEGPPPGRDAGGPPRGEHPYEPSFPGE